MALAVPLATRIGQRPVGLAPQGREMLSDEMKNLRHLQQDIDRRLNESLGLRCKITLVEPNTLPRSKGKAVRVIDNRKQT